MVSNAFFYTLGAILVGTALLALIVAITARKIDFGDRLFTIRKREVPIVDPASKRRTKQRGKPTKSVPSPTPVYDSPTADIEKVASEKTSSDALTGPSPGSGYAPWIDEAAEYKKEKKESLEEAEMIEEESSTDLIETKESVGYLPPPPPDDMSRDLSIQIPKNMCLNEVFRLKITLIKSKEFEKELTIKELELDKKEAEYFSMTARKLGEKITEATTRIEGLVDGPLIVRPIAIGNVAVVSPGQRIIYFDPKAEEIIVEFFITPTRWSKELVSNLRIEFEQNYKIVKAVNIPVKIYKRKLEAIFGFNLSKWQQYVLFIYSALGTISGLISFFNEKVSTTLANWGWI